MWGDKWSQPETTLAYNFIRDVGKISMGKQKGFTLVELMVTLIVLAIILTWAIPSFEKLIEKRRLIGAAEMISQKLVNARTVAVKRSKPIVIDFRTTGTTWSVGVTDKLAGCDASITDETDASACIVDYDASTSGVENFLFRADNGDWSTVTLKGPGEKEAPDFSWGVNLGDCPEDMESQTCFDPVRGLSREGSVVLTSENYTLGIHVTPLGMVRVCTEAGSEKVSGYPTCPGNVL